MTVRIMLDQAPHVIESYTERYGFEFWQLRTPLTGYRLAGVPYGLDNGCFSEFKERVWRKQLMEARGHAPVFACAPDIVGDAARTLDLLEHFKPEMDGLPIALVAQDGVDRFRMPWEDISAVFIGGSDNFKASPAAFAVARCAKMMGKWVHVGRVNTARRLSDWLDLADSIDGSGISRYDHMLEDVLSMILGTHPQEALWTAGQ